MNEIESSNKIRNWNKMCQVASAAGGWLEMTGGKMCFKSREYPPSHETKINLKNAVPNKLKEMVHRVEQQQKKVEGKAAHERKNYQKSRAGRAAFLPFP